MQAIFSMSSWFHPGRNRNDEDTGSAYRDIRVRFTQVNYANRFRVELVAPFAVLRRSGGTTRWPVARLRTCHASRPGLRRVLDQILGRSVPGIEMPVCGAEGAGITPELLRIASEAVYGLNWKLPMSKELGYSARHMQRIMRGETSTSSLERIRPKLMDLLRRKADEIEYARWILKTSLDGTVPVAAWAEWQATRKKRSWTCTSSPKPTLRRSRKPMRPVASFPGITDNATAREQARRIAAWTPLPDCPKRVRRDKVP